MPASSPGPLAGIRVLDLTMWVQGPVGGTLLGDLGADVIKIEKAGVGDFVRGLNSVYGVDLRREGDGDNLLWAACNRNKRGLALDLRHPDARPAFEALLRGADVFLTNLMAAALDDLGAGEQTVRAINPRIVYARAAGFGELGPLAGDPCQDTVGMAYAGFMHTASADAEMPYYPPGAMSDVLSGTMLAFGVLAALRERDRTGEGQFVTTSQLQTLLWLQALNFGAVANFGTPFDVSDRTRVPNAMMNIYPCGDGKWLAIGMPVMGAWNDVCAAIGRDDLLADERFASMALREANAVALIAELDAHFATAPMAHWLERLRARALWVAPVNRLEDLVDDPQVRANGYLREDARGWKGSRMPFTIRGHEPPPGAAPTHGEHTGEILHEAGFDPAAIESLRASAAAW